MRVIAGKCRSMPLKTIPGRNTRPTTDRIKETLFNIMQMDVPGSRFLDLFAGSGAIGIEALSRGAEHCTFVDSSRQAVRIIKENLKFTKLEADADVYEMDADSAVLSFNRDCAFNLVFLDPPYDNQLEKELLTLLVKAPCIAENALFVVEASKETDFSYAEDLGLACVKNKLYKTNKHVFFRKTYD